MPHISISHFPRTFTASERTRLVSELTDTVTRLFGVEEGAVSIAVEPVEPSQWVRRVHTPQIEAKADLLWKQPHYYEPIPTEGTR